VNNEEASGSIKIGEVFNLKSNCSFLKKELLDYINPYPANVEYRVRS
jgi:hypothetical protein